MPWDETGWNDYYSQIDSDLSYLNNRLKDARALYLHENEDSKDDYDRLYIEKLRLEQEINRHIEDADKSGLADIYDQHSQDIISADSHGYDGIRYNNTGEPLSWDNTDQTIPSLEFIEDHLNKLSRSIAEQTAYAAVILMSVFGSSPSKKLPNPIQNQMLNDLESRIKYGPSTEEQIRSLERLFGIANDPVSILDIYQEKFDMHHPEGSSIDNLVNKLFYPNDNNYEAPTIVDSYIQFTLSILFSTGFLSAKSFAPARRIDPLALDLDGDGIETLAIGTLQNTTLFDHDNDGQAAGSGWLSSDDGWLVRDLDGNGAIDSGRELFGNNTILSDGSAAAEGFSALADLDKDSEGNSDGVIDSNDVAFTELQVWQDLNQDGISQANELSSLTDLGITSINLSPTEVNQEQNGNIIRRTSSFTRADGTASTIANLDLAESSLFTEYLDANVGDTSLPDIHGMGGVRNLRDAASRSSGLTTVIENIVNATTHDDRIAQLDNLVEGWAATSDMQSIKVAA